MKSILIIFFTLFPLILGAMNMESPKEVVSKLFIATDSRNWESLEKIFDDKVNLDYSSMTGNPSSELIPNEIITSWKSILPGFEHTHHQIGNFIQSINKEKATVFCYGTDSHFLENENGNLWTVVGTYDFELRQDKLGNWRISSMKFNYKFQDGNLNLPQKAIEIIKKEGNK